MKNTGLLSFPVAALSVALLLPGLTYAQNVNAEPSQDSANQSNQLGADEAAQMVAARAYLTNKLDANDATPGSPFTANLSEAVQLKNGPKLPRGTELVGTVAADDKQLKGTSKLALRITEAHLKDGTTIPLKATIVGVWGPESETAQGYSIAPGEEEANDWTQNVLTVEEINAGSGVDLHSKIAAQNSGVFVAEKKKDVKLRAGSELALAIAEQNNDQQQSGASGGN